jgi:saccharopine dehydrogenase-like NADP-dependent oxidoreductase
MKLLLLGATGVMGRRVATEVIRFGKLERLTIAARDPVELERVAELLRGTIEVVHLAFDLTDGDVARHFEGHDLVLSCAGPGYLLEETCVEAALSAGVDYISLNDDLAPMQAVSARHDYAVERGITIVSGCGLAPGLSNLLVALAARSLDTVEETEISVAASASDGGGDATDLHFVSMFRRDAALDGRDARSPHPVYFPDPVGWIETFASEHPEEVAFKARYPSLETFRFRVGLGEKAVMDAIRAGAAAGLAGSERRRRAWLKASAPLRPLLASMSPGAAGWTGLRVDVRGRKNNRIKTVSYGVVDRLANLVSVPLVRVASSLPVGTKGVVPPDQLVDPAALLREIAARGIRFGELEPHSL